MRKILFALISLVAILALVGCGGSQDTADQGSSTSGSGDSTSAESTSSEGGFIPGSTGVAYNYTHGGYVGMAEVSVGQDGSLDITLDEAFLPHTLAEVDMESGDWNEDNTAYYVVRGEEVRVAKYISYSGTNYVGETVGTALVYVEADENGMPAGSSQLEKSILRNQDTMAAYYDNILGGELAVYTEFGGDAMVVSESPYGGLTKLDSEYWNFGIGWKGNMEAIIEAATTQGIAYTTDEMVRGDDNLWSLDAVTAATASDFIDYFGLIQAAAAQVRDTESYATGQNAVAYAYTHGGYVGMVEASVSSDGSLDLMIDEAYLPHTLAEVDLESADWNESNTVFYVQRDEEVRVAKHISYAGTNYVGVTVGTALVYVEADENGMPAGSLDIEKAILRNQSTMAAYYENLAAEEFVIYTEFGGTAMPVVESPYNGGLTKQTSEYWNFGIGWKGNMDAIIEAAESEGTAFTLDQMVRGDDNTWTLVDATTAATVSDFKDYFTTIQMAVGQLEVE